MRARTPGGTGAVDRRQPRVAGLASVEPAVEVQEVVDPELPGPRGRLLGLDTGGRGARVVLGLLAGPARRLVAAPCRGQRRQRQQQHGAELEPALYAVGRCGMWILRQLVRRVRVDVTHVPSLADWRRPTSPQAGESARHPI